MRSLQNFEETFSGFVTLIRSLPEGIFLKPFNDWSPRDVVAHLVGWNGLMLASCQDILQGKLPAYYANVGDDYWEINARFVARFAQRDRETLLGQLVGSKQALVAFLKTVEPAGWQADHGVVHHSGGPATVARTRLSGSHQADRGLVEAGRNRIRRFAEELKTR